MAHHLSEHISDPVRIVNAGGSSPVVLVCEHATNHIPANLNALGLDATALQSHVAWDPGAMNVALMLSEALDATVIAGGVSRLVYDCNRPPDASDAIPERSEVTDIPGNTGLDAAARRARAEAYYLPFRSALADRIRIAPNPVIVTIHSFTPVYFGRSRAVEIGVLHDADARLAEALLLAAPDHTDADVRRNQPYGPDDGVTHTLKEHAAPGGHLNAMLEVRSDLIRDNADQSAMAAMIGTWLEAALAGLGARGDVSCLA